MSTEVIVVVSDGENARRGEITVVDNPETAAHLVETLLEAGFDQAQIRLFSGHQAQMQIGSRPVVALVDDRSASTAVDERPAKMAVEMGTPAVTPGREEATPYMRDGVRFSSIFRAA